jgi:hypothetical protein
MNRPGRNAKLAAALVGILLVGFSLPGRVQSAPPDKIVQPMAAKNRAPRPENGFLGSDYGLVSQGRSGQETMLLYVNPNTNRKTVRHSLLSWPRTSLFAVIEADEVSRRNAISGSTDLTKADPLMRADEKTEHLRPLLEIPLGVYKLPVFLYVPDRQVDQPSW